MNWKQLGNGLSLNWNYNTLDDYSKIYNKKKLVNYKNIILIIKINTAGN